MFKDQVIPAKDVLHYACGIVMEAGDTLQGLADVTNKVTINIAGEEWY